jgi:hypothetical protein
MQEGEDEREGQSSGEARLDSLGLGLGDEPWGFALDEELLMSSQLMESDEDEGDESGEEEGEQPQVRVGMRIRRTVGTGRGDQQDLSVLMRTNVHTRTVRCWMLRYGGLCSSH